MKAVVYHWWDNHHPIAFKNIRLPILPSIATLRAHNSYTPIYVLDCSEQTAHWGDFPRKLGFKVVPWKMSYQGHTEPYVEYLARMKDIFQFSLQIPQSEIIYCDSDVFWFRDPLPLFCSPDLFCSNRYNNGFFYFDKTSPACYQFFELFAATGLKCLHFPDFKESITQKTKSPALDEIIVDYLFEIHPELVNRIRNVEHSTIRDFKTNRLDFKTVKMFHCNSLMVENKFHKMYGNPKHARGLVALIFQEFHDALTSVLNRDELETIYSCDEVDYYTGEIKLLGPDFVGKLQSLNLDPSKNVHLKEVLSEQIPLI